MRTIHVYAGLLLPIPVLVAIASARRRASCATTSVGSTVGRATIRRWWSSAGAAPAQLGKFNPGQKLNAIFIGASIVVMLMTGSIMQWFKPFSDSWRQGATFVHDWFAIRLLFAIVGHIMFAFRDPDALNGMMHGWVKRRLGAGAPSALVRGDDRRSDGGAACARCGRRRRGRRRASTRPKSGLGAGEMPVVDPVHGRAGDGVGDREL